MSNLENEKIIQAEIIENIENYETIIIHRHLRPDPDAIGSQYGLKEIILNTYPKKKVYAVGSGAETLTFLAEMDSVSDDVYNSALVIVCDSANAPRIDDHRYKTGDKIIKIDHHPKNAEGNYADLTWENPTYSSTSEMVATLWMNHKDQLQMSDEAARLLYAGIIGDTNRFLYAATSPQTMEVAADLMRFDFDHTFLNDQLSMMSKGESRLLGYTLEHLNVLNSGAAYLVLTQDILDKYGLTDADTSGIVPVPRDIEGVLVWCIFVQQTDGAYRCRIRSKGPVINGLASEHGGGGHALASGADAADAEEIQTIIDKMDNLAKAWPNISE